MYISHTHTSDKTTSIDATGDNTGKLYMKGLCAHTLNHSYNTHVLKALTSTHRRFNGDNAVLVIVVIVTHSE